MAALRLCLLSPGVPGADEADAVAQHLRRLTAAPGAEATLALTDHEPLGGGAVALSDAVAANEPFDVAIAVTWDASVGLFDVPARRHALLVDGFAHHRMSVWQPERIAAALAYDLPVDFVCRGAWIAEALAELRPDARAVVAPDGVAKEVFIAEEDRGAPGGPLRVLVDERHGREEDTALGPAALERTDADLTVEKLDAADTAAQRAERMRRADVLLMLSTVDGVLGSPLEAMHCGAIPLVLPAGGSSDLVGHLENGIVAEPDDVLGIARWLDTLARDADLRTRLRAGALDTAAAWPDWDAAHAGLLEVLATLVDTDPPAAAQWPQRLMSDAMALTSAFRHEHLQLGASLERMERDEAYRLGVALRAAWRSRVPLPLRLLLGRTARRLGARRGAP